MPNLKIGKTAIMFFSKTLGRSLRRNKKHLSLTAISSVLFAATACGQTSVETNTLDASLRAKNTEIHYTVNEGPPNPWIISPEINPDVLTLECASQKTTRVTFVTEIETQTFDVSFEKQVRFDIILDDGSVAKTAIACTSLPRRYQGDYSPQRKTAGNLAADLGPLIDTYVDSDGPGAVLSIWKNGKPLFEYERGLSDVKARQLRDLSQPFDIGSVSKEFTMVSIMQLAERGKLKFSDPLSKYAPDIQNADKITIANLLNHTHGLPHYLQNATYAPNRPLTLDEITRLLNEQDLRFKAGTRLEYGNTGYFLLAKIAEMASGQSRERYIRENIFAPLGMTQSGFFYTDAEKLVPVQGYKDVAGRYTITGPIVHPTHMAGIGDIVSTASDLRLWQKAISEGAMLTPSSFDRAYAQTVLPDGSKRARGYGFMIGYIGGQKFFYNSGDFHTHTQHAYFPETGLSIVFNTAITRENDLGEPSVILAQILGKLFDQQNIQLLNMDVDLNEL
ncbi:serine hydrolase domain-containing protein [Erythrobacter crassostreae]|uniref:Beta-lactamase family protein n=1 Tax=Erythrobacter crassostreae TaxID=2828328 RepID=A0A9X1F2B6_9SPHN|nr:serine hydrolase domain-containing protein [Erythrobacter crassostrea]MBV7259002.1 beta-lactamase family protein [Erythrobacter crassostrea]